MEGFTQVNSIVAIATMLGVIISSIFSYLSKVHAKTARKNAEEANDAVNHRHTTEPKLYDLALKNHAMARELIEWKRGYAEGPLDSGSKAQNFVNATNAHIERLDKKIDQIKTSCPVCPDKSPSG